MLGSLPFINKNKRSSGNKDQQVEPNRPMTLEEKERYVDNDIRDSIYNYYAISTIDCYFLTIYVHTTEQDFKCECKG